MVGGGGVLEMRYEWGYLWWMSVTLVDVGE